MQEVKEQLEDSERAIEAIEPAVPTRRLRFTWPAPDGVERVFEYEQAPLGMFPANEFMTMMTRIVKDVLEGRYGINVGELLASRSRISAQMPAEFTADAVNTTLQENMQYVKAFLHVLEIIPELQADITALSLGVRRGERDFFKDRISEPPHRGGLTVDEGVDILKWFIRQNGALIRRFLEDQTRELWAELEPILFTEGETDPTVNGPSPGSRPSSTTSQDTLASD